MQLQDSVCHRQTDPAAFALRGEVQIEDLLPDLLRNPHAFIQDAQRSELAVRLKHYVQPSPIRHGLRPILNYVRRPLFNQTGVEVGFPGLEWQTPVSVTLRVESSSVASAST